MEKVKKFKTLCQELENRKLDLDEELKNYVNIVANLNERDIYVTHGGIVDINSKLSHEKKLETEKYLQEVENKVKEQSDRIKERQKAFSEAFDEIKCILENYFSQPYFGDLIKKIQNIGVYNDLLAIEFGESMINNIKNSFSAN